VVAHGHRVVAAFFGELCELVRLPVRVARRDVS
jgi:hypothetical protein